jgi:hypothetical protein
MHYLIGTERFLILGQVHEIPVCSYFWADFIHNHFESPNTYAVIIKHECLSLSKIFPYVIICLFDVCTSYVHNC